MARPSDKRGAGVRYGVPDMASVRPIGNHEALDLLLKRRAERDATKPSASLDSAEQHRLVEVKWVQKQVSKFLLGTPAAFQTPENIAAAHAVLNASSVKPPKNLQQQIIDIRAATPLEMFVVLSERGVSIEACEELAGQIASTLPRTIVPGCPAAFAAMHFDVPRDTSSATASVPMAESAAQSHAIPPSAAPSTTIEPQTTASSEAASATNGNTTAANGSKKRGQGKVTDETPHEEATGAKRKRSRSDATAPPTKAEDTAEHQTAAAPSKRGRKK